MAEPPAATPWGVAAPEQDALLATKLHVPRPQPGFVPRPRLVQALDEGLARGLVLVCAPAGSGKTALLADWARRGQRPVAWLSLDAADNDPARFWRHAAAALDRVSPGIAERVGPLLGPPAPASFEGLVTALINELAAQPGADEMLLVLDDYQLTRQAWRADGERAELVHLDRAGVRRRNRLRAVGHRPLPRRAAPPSRPAPGDDHRGATPRCAAHRRGGRPAERGRGSAGDWARRER